jgi:hypothetical protein
MTHPIGYFTNDDRARLLTERFGDHDLQQLPQIDQAALTVALSGLMMASLAGLTVTLEAAAEACIPSTYDFTSDAVQEAIAILDGIHPDEAIGVLQFLVQ